MFLGIISFTGVTKYENVFLTFWYVSESRGWDRTWNGRNSGNNGLWNVHVLWIMGLRTGGFHYFPLFGLYVLLEVIFVQRKTSYKAILAAILMYYYDFEILKLCKRQIGSLKNKSSRVRHVLLHPKTDDPLEEALLWTWD